MLCFFIFRGNTLRRGYSPLYHFSISKNVLLKMCNWFRPNIRNAERLELSFPPDVRLPTHRRYICLDYIRRCTPFQRTCYVSLFDDAKVIHFSETAKHFPLKNVNASNKFSKTDGFCRCWSVHSLGVGNTISNIQTAINPYVHLRLHPFTDIPF